jgi:hypothetical protein
MRPERMEANLRTVTSIVGALLLLLSSVLTTHAQLVIKQPDLAAASQLIFYYDAREGFTTFVNIQNRSGDPVAFLFQVWGPTFETDISFVVNLAAGAVRVFDIGSFKVTDGMAAQQGIAVASVVNGPNSPLRVSTRALHGNFTVANLATGSAWGSPAVGRGARAASGNPVPDGTIVDGVTTVYQTVQPDAVALATYYNPQTLAPLQDHGNQLIFVNFRDTPSNNPCCPTLASASTNWLFFVRRGADGTVLSTQLDVTGVAERDLVSLLGTEANGAPGGGGFARGAGTENANRFIFFVQSLGTFGTGYLLPSLD